MKKLILILTLFQLFVFSILAQNFTVDQQKAIEIKRLTVENFKTGKLDEALNYARQSVDLTVKAFGGEHDETAGAYGNLGMLYRMKKKYKEASENLEKAFRIYNLNPAKNKKAIAETLEALALAQALGGDKKRAGESFALALTAAENVYGKDGREMLPFLKTLSDFYIFSERYDEAQATFVRRYQTTSKYFEDDDAKRQEIEDEFYCFSIQKFETKEALERDKRFREAIRTDEDRNAPVVAKGGVVNQGAKYLAKPEYPSIARERRSQGKVLVRVTIDEKGNVIDAEAVCGDEYLRRSSEDAARKSKFTPTLLDGQAVKVSGVIIYAYFP